MRAGPGEPCPLSIDECRDLYATNASTTPDDDHYLDHTLPTLAELPSPEDVSLSIHRADELQSEGPIDKRYWPSTRFTLGHIADLERVLGDAREIVSEFLSFDGWRLAVVDAGRSAGSRRVAWQRLVGVIQAACEVAATAEGSVVLQRPEVSEDAPVAQQLELALEVHRHLERGGTLGWWTLTTHPTWKSAIGAWTTAGERPRLAEHFAAIASLLQVRMARSELAQLWDALMAAHGAVRASELGEQIERGAEQFLVILQDCLDWWNRRCLPVQNSLQELRFDWNRFIGEQPQDLTSYGDMRRIIRAIDEQLIHDLERLTNQLRALHLKKRTGDILTRLDRYTHPQVTELQASLRHQCDEEYTTAYNSLLGIIDRRENAKRRKQLLDRLTRRTSNGQVVADSWADSIRRRVDVHGQLASPGNVMHAWQWRQLHDELENRSRFDTDSASAQAEQLQAQLAEITNQLIDRKAWAAQVRRTGRSQRQALINWLDLIRRIGKGYGRRVPNSVPGRGNRWKAAARRYRSGLCRCRESLKALISPRHVLTS